MDDPSARAVLFIKEHMSLNIQDGGSAKIVGASLHPQKAKNGGKADPMVDEGLEWLIKKIISRFDIISER
eukprot:4916575-Ditylum_brightwellii.AAC.1